jgi:hypothetical protein
MLDLPISRTSRSAGSTPFRSIGENYRLLASPDAIFGDRDSVTHLAGSRTGTAVAC